jgi:hypothetical protein
MTTQPRHRLDVCKCGDYWHQHPNGGPSALNWDNPKGVEPCMGFRLAKAYMPDEDDYCPSDPRGPGRPSSKVKP